MFEARRPPQEDIQLALDIENNVTKENLSFYLKCMNDKPMSKRNTNLELRDGCILTHSVYLHILNNKQE